MARRTARTTAAAARRHGPDPDRVTPGRPWGWYRTTRQPTSELARHTTACHTDVVQEQRVPSTGQVIMFCFVAAGWLVLFVINLIGFEQDVGWWIRGVLSGLFAIGSVAIASLAAP